MPVSFREEQGCGVLELSGRYTVQEAREALQQGWSSLTNEIAPGLVVDLSGSDMVGDRKSADIVRAAAGMSMISDRFSNRIGIVTASAVAYGLMRMGGAHAERAGLSVRVCHTRQAAIDWVLRGEVHAEDF
jgi:hypothetical protein